MKLTTCIFLEVSLGTGPVFYARALLSSPRQILFWGMVVWIDLVEDNSSFYLTSQHSQHPI